MCAKSESLLNGGRIDSLLIRWGVRGAKASEGNTYEEALARLRLSMDVRADSLSASLVAMRPPVLEACVAEIPNNADFPG